MGDDLYVICGFAGEETRDVHEFSQGKWTKLADFPEGLVSRSVAAACALPTLNLICIFGGEVVASNLGHLGAGDFTNEVIAFSCSDKVVFKPTLVGESPAHRGWLDCALLDQGPDFAKVVYFGGLTGDDKAPVRMNDLWTLEIRKV